MPTTPNSADLGSLMRLARTVIAVVVVMATSIFPNSCSRDPQKAKARYLSAGHAYMEKGRYGDAAIEFRNVLRLDPRFVEAYYQLAQADIALRDWSAAYSSLEKAIELDPSRLDTRLDRGRLFLAARQFDKAEDEARFILKQDSTNVGATQLLGATLMGERKPDESLEAFSRVTKLLPNDSSAYVNMALVEISLHRPADAERDLHEAVAVNPKATQSYIALGNLYRLQNRFPQAEEILAEGVSRNSEEIILYIEWARVLIRQGKKDAAETVLGKLRERLPNSPKAAMAIGDLRSQQNQMDLALAEYRRGLSASPKNLEILKRVQHIYLDSGQTRLAVETDRDLTKIAPKDVLVRTDHARLLMAQGKLSDAIVCLQAVVADAADSAQAHYFLGMAYLQNEEPERANSALLDALKLSRESGILQALVRLNLARGNLSTAQSYAQELVQKVPADASYRQLLAAALARQEQFRLAEEQILIARQLAPDNPMIHLNLAGIYTAESKWARAQDELESASRLDPHSPVILGQWTDFLVARHQSAQAISRLQQYVRANPDNANGHVLLGALQVELKDYTFAQAELERAIQIDPRNVAAYLQLGKVFLAQQQVYLAIAQYQKALDLRPANSPLAALVGKLYLDKGDLQEARKYFVQILKTDPNFALANANLAWIDAEEGKELNLALGMAQKAKSLMPNTPSVTDTLAWVMYKKGNYAGAMPLLQECVDKSPDSAIFHYHLGMTLVATGQKPQGKAQLESALRMKLRIGDAQEAQKVLAQLN